MPDYKSTRHTFAKPAKETIAASKKDSFVAQYQYPSDLGEYKFLMQFSKYKFVSGRGDANYEKVEMSKSIAFPMPSNLSQSYTLNVGSELEIGGLQQGGIRALADVLEEGEDERNSILSTYFQGIVGSAEGNTNASTDNAGSGGRALVSGTVKGAPKLGVFGAKLGKFGITASKAFATIAPKNMVSSIETGLGNLFNPVLAASFKGPNLRSHNFEWRVVPRNAAESKTLNDIIRKIRRAIHPALSGLAFDDGNLAMEYPEVCTCALLMPDNDQNIFYKPALISSFKVDHSEGGLAFFQNTGNPVSYKITMIMTELDIISKEDFDALEADEGTEG